METFLIPAVHSVLVAFILYQLCVINKKALINIVKAICAVCVVMAIAFSIRDLRQHVKTTSVAEQSVHPQSFYDFDTVYRAK